MVHRLFLTAQPCEGTKPGQGDPASECSLHGLPTWHFAPLPRLSLQAFDSCLIGTDGVDLGAKHHRGEDEEEEALKAQEDEKYDCCWRREGAALCPIIFKAVEEMEDHHDQRVQRNECNVHCEKHKVLLVVFANTVVHPRTVVVHLPDAAFAYTGNPTERSSLVHRTRMNNITRHSTLKVTPLQSICITCPE